jgi:hypothetical protein
MITIETADQKEVRRFRIAQFNGRTATFRSGGSAVTGLVRSIVENKTSNPSVWVVTLIPSESRVRTGMLRPSPRVRAFAGDCR